MMTHECPDAEVLGALFDGLLPPVEEDALYARMIGCGECQEVLATLGLAAEAELEQVALEVPSQLLEHVRSLGAADAAQGQASVEGALEAVVALAVRWVSGLLEPLTDALAPTPLASVAVRGSADPGDVNVQAERLRYDVEVGGLALELVLTAEDDGRVSVQARPTTAPTAGLALRLSTGGRAQAVTSFGADGATLHGLEPGAYDVTVESRGEPLGHLTLSLGRVGT